MPSRARDQFQAPTGAEGLEVGNVGKRGISSWARMAKAPRRLGVSEASYENFEFDTIYTSATHAKAHTHTIWIPLPGAHKHLACEKAEWMASWLLHSLASWLADVKEEGGG